MNEAGPRHGDLSCTQAQDRVTQPHLQETRSTLQPSFSRGVLLRALPKLRGSLEHLQIQWLRDGSSMVPGLQVQRKLPRVFTHSASLHRPCIKHSLISVNRREPGEM